jgi:hypothetical protein
MTSYQAMTSYQESDSASRRDESKDSFGCLIPLIASTVFLAIAVTLVSWFVLSDEQENARSGGSDATVESSPTTGPKELLDGMSDDDAASSQALLEVVRSADWKEFGQPEAIDLGSKLQVARKFRRPQDGRQQDRHIQITIHTLKSEGAAQAVLEATALPARAVQFDNKVIVVEPITDATKAMVAPLADRLRTFREVLDEQETSE